MTTPEPLVPAECTMTGNDWFPLHFDRLRKSKWWRRASDLARARNVMLWGEAYKQVPAGSMPDDDDDLAEAAGFGMDVDGFMAAKAEIMAPWVLCSDGRWYHPTVCEVVLEAWERASERKRLTAAKKAAQRAKTRGQAPPTPRVPTENANVPHEHENVPGDIEENGRDIGTHNRQDSTGQTEPPLTPQGGQEAGLFDVDPKPDGRRKPKRSIPADFPDASAIAEQQAKARAAGKNIDLSYQAERFRNWAIGKDAKYADWTATWRNWAGKAIQEAPAAAFGASASAAPAATIAVDADALWRRRVQAFSRNAYWNRLEWGPAPGQPGCRITPEIQREFDVQPAKPQPIGSAA